MKYLFVIVFLISFSCFPSLVAAQPTNRENSEFARGWDLFNRKQYQEARSAFQSALASNPSNALGHFYLGNACRGLRDWDCAAEHYETALDLDQQFVEATLAKKRLIRARAWQMLKNMQQVLNNDNVSSDKVSAAKEVLQIVSEFDLNEEQKVLSKILQGKIKKKTETQESQANIEMLRKLEGKWKFIGGTCLYELKLPNKEELEMRLVGPKRCFGLNPGDRFLWNFQRIKEGGVNIPFYERSVQGRFRDGAEIYAAVVFMESYQFQQNKRYGFECNRRIFGDSAVQGVFAYAPSTDTIRLLPRQYFSQWMRCEIEVKSMFDKRDSFFTDGWLRELTRQ